MILEKNKTRNIRITGTGFCRRIGLNTEERRYFASDCLSEIGGKNFEILPIFTQIIV
jgi:hypothetical protein